MTDYSLRNLLTIHRVEALLGTPVVDQTGLTGEFDIPLEFVPDQSASQIEGPSLLVAMEEQLGLTFERRTDILEVVVIDSVERPAPD